MDGLTCRTTGKAAEVPRSSYNDTTNDSVANSIFSFITCFDYMDTNIGIA
jgi:hypothetical protein